MRIAVITNDYPPNIRGGAGVIAETYATALKERGHELMVEVCRPSFTRMSAFRRLIWHLRDLSPRNEIVKKIMTWKPDVLLTHNLTGCGMGTPKAIQRHGIRWVHILHDVQLIEPSGRIVIGESFHTLRVLWRFIWTTLRRVAIGRPDLVVSPTEWLLEFHRRRGLFMMVNGRIIPNPMTSIEALSEDEERDGILFVNRLDPEKGVRILLDAWKALGDARPTLHLVGSGSLEATLRTANDPKLMIHGQLPNAEVRQLMRRVKTLVVPSLLIENQPTVILEGLAVGCWVITSDVGGSSETLGSAGRIVPAGDVAALTAALAEDGKTSNRRSEILNVHRVEVAVAALESALRSN